MSDMGFAKAVLFAGVVIRRGITQAGLITESIGCYMKKITGFNLDIEDLHFFPSGCPCIFFPSGCPLALQAAGGCL